MIAKLAELTAAMSALSREEKLTLADDLFGEPGPENPAAYAAAWDVEIQRRRDEVLSGKVNLLTLVAAERSTTRLLECR